MTSESAIIVAVRDERSMTAISPKTMPAENVDSRLRIPEPDGMKTLAFPFARKNNLSPLSPALMMPLPVSQDCLREKFLLLNSRARPEPAHPDSGLQRGAPH
jgi:hypothetical protein